MSCRCCIKNREQIFDCDLDGRNNYTLPLGMPTGEYAVTLNTNGFLDSTIILQYGGYTCGTSINAYNRAVAEGYADLTDGGPPPPNACATDEAFILPELRDHYPISNCAAFISSLCCNQNFLFPPCNSINDFVATVLVKFLLLTFPVSGTMGSVSRGVSLTIDMGMNIKDPNITVPPFTNSLVIQTRSYGFSTTYTAIIPSIIDGNWLNTLTLYRTGNLAKRICKSNSSLSDDCAAPSYTFFMNDYNNLPDVIQLVKIS